MALTDAEYSDTHTDIDFHKRPSRRELEKENQQLRAMLRQQQEVQVQKTPKPTLEKNRSASTKQIAPLSEISTVNQDTKTPSKRKASKSKAKDIPPVPSVPDRIALQPLSNARNQPRSTNTNPVTTNINNNANVKNEGLDLKPSTANNSNNNPTKRIVAGPALPRPVSMILEEDEEGVENRTPGGKQSLAVEDITKLKQLTPSPVRMHAIKREQWEWPDDIF
jgi:hypothetical protein